MGYKNREYLSGEWAAAISYQGGHLSGIPRWLTPFFVFPDFLTTGPNYGIHTGFHFSTPPTNSYGYPVYQSIITNADLRITIVYEMMDLGTNQAGQLAVGIVAKGLGGVGGFIRARYLFKQTYRVTNISGNALTSLRIFQLIHGLESTRGVYDDRAYGGGLPDYRHTLSLQGASRGFNSMTLETAEHNDTIAISSSMQPWAYEVGKFGGTINGDDHQTGKPNEGVHLSVESGMLGANVDNFTTTGDYWVSAAMCWTLGSMAINETKSLDLMFSAYTDTTIVRPPVNLSIGNTARVGNEFWIDFQETSGHPELGYGLYKAADFRDLHSEYTLQPVGYQINVPQAGWNRFKVPINSMEPKASYFIQGILTE
jgi:hypothetical protein